MSQVQKIDNVSVGVKANIYFDGKVISHSVFMADGSKKTVGLIFPGTYKFNTDAPERMDITAGACTIRIDGAGDWKPYAAGTYFKVPGKSFFEITVEGAIAEYICSFE